MHYYYYQKILEIFNLNFAGLSVSNSFFLCQFGSHLIVNVTYLTSFKANMIQKWNSKPIIYLKI